MVNQPELKEINTADIFSFNDNTEDIDEKLKENINELGIKDPLAVVPNNDDPKVNTKYRIMNEESQKIFNIILSLGWEKVSCHIFQRPTGSDSILKG